MQINCKYYSEIPIKIPKNNPKCPMVYIKQITLHDDLQIQYVSETINKKASKHFQKLALHPNQSVNSLCLYPEARRLKRKWPQDLQNT